MFDRPAILGGPKAFAEGVPLCRPAVAPWEEAAPELEKMYRSGWLTKGPYLQAFEEKMADLLQVKHVIGLGSCTGGLILGLQALGINKPGGEVIVPSFSFMATFHAIWWNNLKPVFVDCEPDTFTVDIAEIEKAVNKNTVAIAAVGVFGNAPDFEGLEALSEKYSLPLFFDSAHGLGTIYKGRPLGGHGSFEVFSLSATKLLTGGEGGLLTTNDDRVAAHVRAGRDYGNPGSYDCPSIGLNARMAEANAIIASKSADYLESYAEHRNKVAETYKNGLADLPGLSFQKIREGCRSSYKDFAILAGPEFGIERDVLAKALNAEGVPSRAYFNPPGHKLSCYAYAAEGVKLPVTERISASVICPPIFSRMDLQTVSGICEVFHKLYAYRDELK
ncbi:DegT/DnrJ/EryC1/StrS family aminotransferase [bacterium]|nr:DegT/DnrJ/EryC1/StrS family aminotransferase [bacterium]